MNTFWLKIAGVGILAVVVLIVAGQFIGGDDAVRDEPVQSDSSRSPSSDVYEQDAKDHERLTAPVCCGYQHNDGAVCRVQHADPRPVRKRLQREVRRHLCVGERPSTV